MDRIKSELQGIKTSLIDNVLKFLETGNFENRTNNAYVNAYSRVVSLGEVSENGEFLYLYYKKTIKDYTVNTVKSELMKLRGVELLKKLSFR